MSFIWFIPQLCLHNTSNSQSLPKWINALKSSNETSNLTFQNQKLLSLSWCIKLVWTALVFDRSKLLNTRPFKGWARVHFGCRIYSSCLTDRHVLFALCLITLLHQAFLSYLSIPYYRQVHACACDTWGNYRAYAQDKGMQQTHKSHISMLRWLSTFAANHR